MDGARNIVGININIEDIERTTSNTKETTLMNTAIKFLSDELGFWKEQITDMDITRVTKTKKADGKTLYLTLPHNTSVTQIFKRTATVQNNNMRISNQGDRYYPLWISTNTERYLLWIHHFLGQHLRLRYQWHHLLKVGLTYIHNQTHK